MGDTWLMKQMKPPDGRLYTPREIYKMFNISSKTLVNWSDAGKIRTVKTIGGHRRYILEDFDTPRDHPLSRRRICYCRVSSSGQKQDLERQVDSLRSLYPDHEIVRDIGSGINFKRKGFISILESAKNGHVEEIVVAHKDRLCRFGFELVKRVLEDWSGANIVVLNKTDSSKQDELVGDIISIITIFSARVHGIRSYTKKSQKEKEVRTKESGLQNDEVQTDTFSN